MTHDARSVANLFLSMAADEDFELTALGLLKILYFAHAWHLAKYKEPLVGQPFEAWKYGPVNRAVYEQVKGYGRGPVKNLLQRINASTGVFEESKEEFVGEKRIFLKNVFDYYSKFHPYKLVDLTHGEGTPWDSVWRSAEHRAMPGMLISDDLILKWFEETGGRVYVGEHPKRS